MTISRAARPERVGSSPAARGRRVLCQRVPARGDDPPYPQLRCSGPQGEPLRLRPYSAAWQRSRARLFTPLPAVLLLQLAATTPSQAEEPIELLFVGDVSFAGRSLPRRGTSAADMQAPSPFRHVAPYFATATLVVANGEGVLSEEPPAAYGEARLNISASPRWAPTYRSAGIDLVGLANNHTWDGGARGLLENRAHIAGTGVAVMGAGATREEAEAPYRLMAQDPGSPGGGRCRVAILPATRKSNRPPTKGAFAAFYRGAEGLSRLQAAISALRAEGCYVVVTVHWGREGVHQPDRSQVNDAHAMIRAGADLVVGHHPHVLQAIEVQWGNPIVYSLGNFVFTNRDPDKSETGILSVRLSPGHAGTRAKLQELSLLPARIDPRGFTPRPATPKERESTAERLRRWSARFGTRVDVVGERIVVGR